MNEHVHPVFAAILGSTVPELLEDAERREKSRRRRERLHRDAIQQFARDLEESLGLEYLSVDAGALSAALDQYEERKRRLGL